MAYRARPTGDPPAERAHRPAGDTSSAAAKFAVGVTAGTCAAIFPRLTAALYVDRGAAEVNLFLGDYVLLALAFGLLLGVIVTIIEWGVARPPRDTFMAALGIPALFAGALNTTVAVGKLDDVAQRTARDASALIEHTGFPVEDAGGVRQIPLSLGEPVGRNSRLALALPLRLLEPREAEAGEPGERLAQAGGGVGIGVNLPRYLVVVDRFDDAEAARRRANELRAQGAPHAGVYEVRNGFVVTWNGEPTTAAAAVGLAAAAQEKTGSRPTLLKVGK
jgi:hypothetical protein